MTDIDHVKGAVGSQVHIEAYAGLKSNDPTIQEAGRISGRSRLVRSSGSSKLGG